MSGAGKPLVWITRPQPGADRTAEAVAAIGLEPLVLPLTEVRACDPEIDIDAAERAGFVAVTSANAIRLAPKALLDAMRAKPLYAVGNATRAAAEAAGFARAVSAQGAVDDLAALIAAREGPGSEGLYLCGRRRTGDLEDRLAAAGISCRPAEVYATYSVSQPTYKKAIASGGRGPAAALFHSALSAHAFAGAVAASEIHAFEKTLFFALSARIADALPDWARTRVVVAATPDEDHLLAALRAGFAL